MFFSNNKDKEKIANLENKISVLEKEVLFYKEVAAFSQEEILVVLDKSGNIVFQNTLASTLVKCQVSPRCTIPFKAIA